MGGLLLAFAFVTTVSAAENWDVTGTYTLALTCTSGCGGTWNHSMNITVENINTGVFSGTGYFISNPAYTWIIDGTVTGDTLNFHIDYTGLNPTYYVDTVTGSIAMNGSMSGTANAPGQTFNWATTSGYAKFNRYAEITSPAADSIVTDTLILGAFLMDNDYDPVSWAVRNGTCAAATGTVMGNVDGYNDSFDWAVDAGNKYKYVFSASKDVTAWAEGTYCFIFNPSEDAGENDIRLTEFFKVNWDTDNDGSYDNADCAPDNPNIYPGATEICNNIDDNCDGYIDEGSVCDLDNDTIPNGEDYCPLTGVDVPTESWGIHRWLWDGNSWDQQPNKAGKGNGGPFSKEDTHGCSCVQILDILKDETDEDLTGQYKFGCSTGILKTFIASPSEITFLATDSLYYDGPTNSAPLYATGEFSFTWNKYTGAVIGGYYNEIHPPVSGTTYYNAVTGGTVSGNTVHLIFYRSADNYSFTSDGTLSSYTYTGTLAGPYYFTATGI